MTGKPTGTRELTEAQASRLRRLSVAGEYHVSGRPEVRALARRGLVETNGFGCTVITPEGIALLAEHREAARGG